MARRGPGPGAMPEAGGPQPIAAEDGFGNPQLLWAIVCMFSLVFVL